MYLERAQLRWEVLLSARLDTLLPRRPLAEEETMEEEEEEEDWQALWLPRLTRGRVIWATAMTRKATTSGTEERKRTSSARLCSLAILTLSVGS